jgi:hypothetical protein
MEAVPRALAAFNAKNPDAEAQQKFKEDLRLSLKAAKSSIKINARVKTGKGSVVVVGKKARAIVAKRGGVAANKMKIEKLVVKAAPKASKTSSDEQTARRIYLESMRNTRETYRCNVFVYTLENPVRKGLCNVPDEWPWSGMMEPWPVGL